jgi:hypothetical protein
MRQDYLEEEGAEEYGTTAEAHTDQQGTEIELREAH